MGKFSKHNKPKGYQNLKNILPDSPPDSPVKKSPHSKSPACKTPRRKSPRRNTPLVASEARCLSPSEGGGGADSINPLRLNF